MAKKGEKLSKKTKALISKNRTREKTPCEYCGLMIVDMNRHHANSCRNHPDLKEKLRLKRNQDNKRNRERINSLQNIATAKRMLDPKKRKARSDSQRIHRQIPEVKKRLNAKRKIKRPIDDKNVRDCLFFILGGYKCVKCGFHDHRAMEKDHINDDGYLDDEKFTDDRGRDLWYVNHPEKAREKLQPLCSNHNGIKLFEKREKDWNSKNHTRRSIKDRIKYQELTRNAHQILGGDICVICGFKDKRAMDIEHKRGGGRKDRKRHSRYSKFLREIIENPEKSREKLQMMCKNCNTIKEKIKNK